jgi:L-aminopeptidase/D-esterase-like protein
MRFRDIGVSVGTLSTGQRNTICDVAGVLVGHSTLIEGENIRTGVTAILPHGGNIFVERLPAARRDTDRVAALLSTLRKLRQGCCSQSIPEYHKRH